MAMFKSQCFSQRRSAAEPALQAAYRRALRRGAVHVAIGLFRQFKRSNGAELTREDVAEIKRAVIRQRVGRIKAEAPC